MKSSDLIVLAALAAGAYLYTQRAQARATPAAAAAPTITGRPAPTGPAAAISGLVGLAAGIKSLFTGSTGTSYGTQSEGNAGEAEARAYYLSNLDSFAVNPPSTYNYNDGYTGGTGGWLDGQ